MLKIIMMIALQIFTRTITVSVSEKSVFFSENCSVKLRIKTDCQQFAVCDDESELTEKQVKFSHTQCHSEY